MNYQEFIKSKINEKIYHGFDIIHGDINPILFDYQKDIVKWSVKKGKSAIFANTGLGKTFMQAEFAKIVNEKKKSKVLILAPLAVSLQTIQEAKKLEIEIHNLKKDFIPHDINIINYEQIDNINPLDYDCIILDESSILKNISGTIKRKIVESFAHCKFKLACSATPAPNDFMELGNHSEFLNVMKSSEMLSTFFVHDSGETQKWRLKGHAEQKYWEWISSWAVVLRDPADLGYNNKRFELPGLNYVNHVIDKEIIPEGHMFGMEARTLNERREVKKATIEDRCQLAADIVNNSDEIFLVWCELNSESEMLSKIINNSVEIKGNDKPEFKEKAMIDFANGKIKCLITKPKIAGFGMNWQICHNIIYVNLSDSFEQEYQSTRRCYRFGQKKIVNVHKVFSNSERNIINNLARKAKQADQMFIGMVKHTKNMIIKNIHKEEKRKTNYIATEKMKLPNFLLNN